MNKALLMGRLTRDPDTRSLASGKTVTTFTIATADATDGSDRLEYHAIVTWV